MINAGISWPIRETWHILGTIIVTESSILDVDRGPGSFSETSSVLTI